jgi:hypothetical protein
MNNAFSTLTIHSWILTTPFHGGFVSSAHGFSAATHSHITFSSESESYVTTDGQSATWNKVPIWGLRPDFYYCQTVTGLLVWGAVSAERTDLSFTIAAGPRQRSHSRVRVPWDLRPYFTVSYSRLPFSSPPPTRRVTVEVFDPASTRDWFFVKVKITLRLTVSQSVCLGVEPRLGLMTRCFFLFEIIVLSMWRNLSDERSGLSFVSHSR